MIQLEGWPPAITVFSGYQTIVYTLKESYPQKKDEKKREECSALLQARNNLPEAVVDV